MLKYIGKRFLHMIPVLIGSTFLIYALVFLLPGDPVRAMFGDKTPSPELLAQIRAQYNLDKPFIIQYLLYLKGICVGNFGMSFSGRPVLQEIAEAYPVTMQLTFMAIGFEAIFGIVAGLYAGLKKGKIFDQTILIFSLLIISIPTFVFGFLFQFILGVKLRVFPTTVGSNQSFYSLLMPAIVLGLMSFAYILRFTRTSVVTNLQEDYVRTAYAKGLTKRDVIIKHVLRNSLIPVVTYLGTDIGALMGGAIVTEGIFGIAGVGNLLYKSITLGEAPTVVSLVTILVIVFIISNLLVDLLYAALDPRIRYE